MSEQSMPNTQAVTTFKRKGGIIDGAQIARFRRLQQEQSENDGHNDDHNDTHRPTPNDL